LLKIKHLPCGCLSVVVPPVLLTLFSAREVGGGSVLYCCVHTSLQHWSLTTSAPETSKVKPLAAVCIAKPSIAAPPHAKHKLLILPLTNIKTRRCVSSLIFPRQQKPKAFLIATHVIFGISHSGRAS
jgi:hypothetical protein